MGIAVGNSIKEAEKYCKENDLKFTPVRRKVLEILLQKNKALGAYEILDLLREAGFKYQPPVAYRALDFLVKKWFCSQNRTTKQLCWMRTPRKKSFTSVYDLHKLRLCI